MAGIGPEPDVVRERKREPGFLDYLAGGMKFMEKVSKLETTGPALMYLYK